MKKGWRRREGVSEVDGSNVDIPLIVYHSTSFDIAQSFLERGIRIGEKDRTVPDFVNEKGHAYGPGYGLADETYVASDPYDTRLYGGFGFDRVVLAILTSLSELKPSPEALSAHMNTPEKSLAMGHALLTSEIRRNNIRFVGFGTVTMADAYEVLSGSKAYVMGKKIG